MRLGAWLFAILLALFPIGLFGQSAISYAEAHRFLTLATFGPTAAEIDELRAMGYDAWFAKQFNLPASELPADLDEKPMEYTQDYFLENAIEGKDQLRQRMLFALHKLFVVSANKVTDPSAITSYLRMLEGVAFENYYVQLHHVTIHPAMGVYLDMVNSDRATPGGPLPNENYAREVLQLFSIGLQQLNPDGTAKLDANGKTIPTFTEAQIREFARLFTGWTFPSQDATTSATDHNDSYFTGFMVPVERLHDGSAKTLLNGWQVPAGQLAQQDIHSAVGDLYWHDNVGPFIGKQLIQQFVTSNPSPQYVARVAAAFANNGSGLRGDMRAVLKAILLDPEALNPPATSSGKLREPLLYAVAMVRQLVTTVTDHPFLSDSTEQMNQKLLFPPSVFSYFSPGYREPGGLLAPEFQITTGQTAIERANFAGRLIYGYFGEQVKLELTRFINAAGNTNALLDLVNNEVFGQRMTPDLRAAMQKAVDAQSDATAKARAALYLALTAPDYQVIP